MHARDVVIDAPVRHIDIVPTVLDAIGADKDSVLQGASLLPVVNAGEHGDRPSYFEAMTYNLVRGWAPLRGVLQARNKYIDLPLPELSHDLAADPKEAGQPGRRASGERVQVLDEPASRPTTRRRPEPSRPGRTLDATRQRCARSAT